MTLKSMEAGLEVSSSVLLQVTNRACRSDVNAIELIYIEFQTAIMGSQINIIR